MYFDNSDFSEFHNNMESLLIKFCRRKTVNVYVYQGHTLDSKQDIIKVLNLMISSQLANDLSLAN